ncbi:aldose 1-epimerase [Sphingomonas sp.]|uniref:aldose 1-epimerase n=1 Tax=Sphingomonas sp. TaxID=28214 RepID=UPI0025EDE5F9|nr:aldose 1-epimerase [Sphingomonas sp.]
MERRLFLHAGLLELQLMPSIGGSIVRFDHVLGKRRQPLLRAGNGTISDVLDASCFPLVPFVNRIRGGTFTCDERIVTLSINSPGDPSPMHGQGWRASWEVVEENGDRATLSYLHPAGEWPWAYEATQRLALDKNGFSLELSCRNLSPERMPCGLGFHPYYPCTTETVLDTVVESAWTIDAAVLPVENVPATGRYDLRAPPICGQALDNGFDGWGGSALITWPGEQASLRLSSPDAGRFQVYSPPEGGVFVAEPVQNANAALNAPQVDWPALGLTLLAQGQCRALRARFDVLTDDPDA